jgi:hypothetical protein
MLEEGIAFVVTDLHGNWEAYSALRDRFLARRARGEAHYFVLLGDMIHGYETEAEDRSLDILLDLVALRDRLGPNVVIPLLGNHELPHLYGAQLSFGPLEFTARFEHALGTKRRAVDDLLEGLPFLVRTPGGVALTHAGATERVAFPSAARRLRHFSHATLRARLDALLAERGLIGTIHALLCVSEEDYAEMARSSLAVDGPADPRYPFLVRSLLLGACAPDWPELWDMLSSPCEQRIGGEAYRPVLARFLDSISEGGPEQRVLVTGHLAVKDGFSVVAGRQLRIATWTHSLPRESGRVLTFDVTRRFEDAAELASNLERTDP